MKRGLLVILLVSCFFISTKSTEARGGIGVAFGQPSGVTFRINRFPVVTLGYSFLLGKQYFYGSLDFWIINNPIQGQFFWYLGIGANIGVYNSGQNPLRLGARVPIGLLWVPTNLIEVFLEAAPGAQLFPTVGFDWQAEIGIRFMIF